MSWIGLLLLFLLTRLPIMSRKIKVYGKTNPLFGWIISHHFAALFTYFSCEKVMYLMSSFMYIYHFSLSQWLILNQKWAKNISNLKLSKFDLFFPISVHTTFLSMRHIYNLKHQKYDIVYQILTFFALFGIAAILFAHLWFKMVQSGIYHFSLGNVKYKDVEEEGEELFWNGRWGANL